MKRIKLRNLSILRSPSSRQVSTFTLMAVVCLLILPTAAQAQIAELTSFKNLAEKVFALIIGIMFLYGIVSIIAKLTQGNTQALREVLVLAGAVILWVAKDSILRAIGYTG